MRVVHFVKSLVRGLVDPLCGDWGSMASDWTEDPGAVTCGACLAALRAPTPGAAARVGT